MESGKDLRKIRLHLGLNQGLMAEMLGIPFETYRKYESGERLPKSSVFKKITDLCEDKRERTPLEGKIDYLRVRFQTFDWKSVIDKVLLLEGKPFFDTGKTHYGYDHLLEFNGINLYYSKTRQDMGTMIEFSGQVCRKFEWYLVEQDRSWKDFLKDCEAFSKGFTDSEEGLNRFYKITRIDIALDEYYNPKGNFDIAKMQQKRIDGLIQTRIETFEYYDGIKKDQEKGKSFYVGSTKSNFYLNFYEKDREQALKQNLPLEYVHDVLKFKNRYEVRMSGDVSDRFTKNWLKNDDGENLAQKGVKLINEKIKVLTIEDGKKKFDSEWYELMGSYDTLKFVIEPKEEELGVKEFKWLSVQVFPTLVKMMYLDEIMGRNLLQKTIEETELKDDAVHELLYAIRKYNYQGDLIKKLGLQDEVFG